MLVDINKIKNIDFDSIILHQFDCYELGRIAENARLEIWNDVFGEIPNELKNATPSEKWQFYERLIISIQNYMVETFPENETRDGPWAGKEVLYMKFIDPILKDLFYKS